MVSAEQVTLGKRQTGRQTVTENSRSVPPTHCTPLQEDQDVGKNASNAYRIQ